jgi:hypothetical protein
MMTHQMEKTMLSRSDWLLVRSVVTFATTSALAQGAGATKQARHQEGATTYGAHVGVTNLPTPVAARGPHAFTDEVA